MARQRIGRYDILESVGSGGFATVYRAQDSQLGREVALKVLHPHMGGDPQFLDRFLREARLAASIPPPMLTTFLFDRCPKMSHHNLALIRGDRKNPSLQGSADCCA